MSDYFSKVKQGLGDAVERQAHLRWYSRLLRASYARPLVVVVAALAIATPAVGAVTNWFSFGQPNVGPPAHAGIMWGSEKPGSSRLLPMRTPDPLGGPSWGLRMVKTSRGDTCVQLGRVERDQIGSLGIDDAWNNDGLFHEISANDTVDDQCGSTDAAGYGYVNVGMLSEDTSANIGHQGAGSGRTSRGCAPRYRPLPGSRKHPFPHGGAGTEPLCPPGGSRMVFFGMLGPDATSVTYRKPGGGFATQRTVGGVGEYLLVFPYNAANCSEYGTSATRSVSCNSESMGSASPSEPGAVTKITYKDGHSCSLVPSARRETAFRAFERAALAKLGRPKPRSWSGPVRPPSIVKWMAAYRRLLTRFLTREHLTMTDFRDQFGPVPSCPAVGWVAAKGPKVTRAEVATPIGVRVLAAARYGCPVPAKLHLPNGCAGVTELPTKVVPVAWSFKARRAVTNSRSWYEWTVWPDSSSQTRTNCGGSSFATYANVTKGQTLSYSDMYPTDCRGKYTITVGYMASAPPSDTDDSNGGGDMTPGSGGSLVVGRATFTIH